MDLLSISSRFDHFHDDILGGHKGQFLVDMFGDDLGIDDQTWVNRMIKEYNRRRVLGHSLVGSLAPLTHSLAPPYSLRLRAPLRSYVRSLTHSLPSSWERGFCQGNERADFIQLQATALWDKTRSF